MTGQTSATPIGADARARLGALADIMIPAANGMPAATDVGVADAQLTRVLAARPDLTEPLRRATELLPPDPGDARLDALEDLRVRDPEAHDALLAVIVGGYYIHPEIRSRLRYDGQEPREVWPEIIPNYVEEGLIDPVVERGPIFRSVPAEEEHHQ